MDINEDLIGKKVIHKGNIFVIDGFCDEPTVFLESIDTGASLTCGIHSPIAKNLKLFEEPKKKLNDKEQIIKYIESQIAGYEFVLDTKASNVCRVILEDINKLHEVD